MSHVSITPTLGESEPTLRRRIKALGRGWVHCGLLPPCSAWLLRPPVRRQVGPPSSLSAPGTHCPLQALVLLVFMELAPQMLSEGYLKSSSLSHTTNNDLHSSVAESFYVPGTMLRASRLLFYLIFITACKVEDTGLLSHRRSRFRSITRKVTPARKRRSGTQRQVHLTPKPLSCFLGF